MAETPRYTHEQIMQRYGFTGLRVAQWEHNSYATQAPPIRAHTVRPDALRRAAPVVYRYVIPASPKVPAATDDEESEPESEPEPEPAPAPAEGVLSSTADTHPAGGSTEPIDPPALESILKDFNAQEVQSQIKDETASNHAASPKDEKAKRRPKSSVWTAWSRPKKVAKSPAKLVVVDVKPTSDAPGSSVDDTTTQMDVSTSETHADPTELPPPPPPPPTDIDALLSGLAAPAVHDTVLPATDPVILLDAGEMSSTPVDGLQSDIDAILASASPGVVQSEGADSVVVVAEPTSEALPEDHHESRDEDCVPAGAEAVDHKEMSTTAEPVGSVVDDTPSAAPKSSTADIIGPDQKVVSVDDSTAGETPPLEKLDDTTALDSMFISIPGGLPRESPTESPNLDDILASISSPPHTDGDGPSDSPDTSSIAASISSEDKHVSFAPGTPDGKETKRKKKKSKDSTKRRRSSISKNDAAMVKPDDATDADVAAVPVDEPGLAQDSVAKGDDKANAAAAKKSSSKAKTSNKSAGLFAGGALLTFGAKPKSETGKDKKKKTEDKSREAADVLVVGLGIDVTPTTDDQLLADAVEQRTQATADGEEPAETVDIDQVVSPPSLAPQDIEGTLPSEHDPQAEQPVDVLDDTTLAFEGSAPTLATTEDTTIEAAVQHLGQDAMEATADEMAQEATDAATIVEDVTVLPVSGPEPVEDVLASEPDMFMESTTPITSANAVEDIVNLTDGDTTDTTSHEVVIEGRPYDSTDIVVDVNTADSAMDNAQAAEDTPSPVDSGAVLTDTLTDSGAEIKQQSSVDNLLAGTLADNEIPLETPGKDAQPVHEIATDTSAETMEARTPLELEEVPQDEAAQPVEEAVVDGRRAPLPNEDAEPESDGVPEQTEPGEEAVVEDVAAVVIGLATDEPTIVAQDDTLKADSTEPMHVELDTPLPATAVDEATNDDDATEVLHLDSVLGPATTASTETPESAQDPAAADEGAGDSALLTAAPSNDLTDNSTPVELATAETVLSGDLPVDPVPDDSLGRIVSPQDAAVESHPEEPESTAVDDQDPVIDLAGTTIKAATPVIVEHDPAAETAAEGFEAAPATEQAGGETSLEQVDSGQETCATDVISPAEHSLPPPVLQAVPLDGQEPFVAKIVTPDAFAVPDATAVSPTEGKSGHRRRSERGDRPRSSRKTTGDRTRTSKPISDDGKTERRSDKDRRTTQDDADRRRHRDSRRSDERDRVLEEEEEERRLRREARRAARRAQEAEEAARLARQEADAIAQQDAEVRRRRREQRSAKGEPRSKPGVSLLAGLMTGSSVSQSRGDQSRRDAGSRREEGDSSRRQHRDERASKDTDRGKTVARPSRADRPEPSQISAASDSRTRDVQSQREASRTRDRSIASRESRQRSSKKDEERPTDSSRPDNDGRRRRTSERSDARPSLGPRRTTERSDKRSDTRPLDTPRGQGLIGALFRR